jgi:isopentenyldiphosphate isomerase
VSEELLDYYDANMTHLGIKARSAVHQAGDWHRVFNCHVIQRDAAGQDWLIVQQRSAAKATFPLFLDVSAAGHYTAGETIRDGVREVREELGLPVDFADLIPAGRRVSAAQYAGLLDYEVADVFFYVCQQPLSTFTYQQEEVAGLVALPVEPALRLFTGAVEHIPCPAVGLATATINVRQADFTPHQDHYFLKVLLLAQRCLAGERGLWV